MFSSILTLILDNNFLILVYEKGTESHDMREDYKGVWSQPALECENSTHAIGLKVKFDNKKDNKTDRDYGFHWNKGIVAVAMICSGQNGNESR